MAHPVAAAGVGLAAGVLSGAFGVGGGVITTPAIKLLLHYPDLIAVGTPLPVMLPTAATGAWSYARRGLIDVRAGLTLALTGAPASVLGAWLSDVVGGAVVLLVTAVLILYLAYTTLRQALPDATAPRVTYHSGHPRRGVALGFLGAAAGVYSGFLGLGGGFVIVPMLSRWFGLDIKRSIGTSLLSVMLLAVPGSIAHWWLGHVDLPLALLLALGVVPGALLGAHFTHAANERGVRIAFAVLLLVVGLSLAAGELGLLGGV